MAIDIVCDACNNTLESYEEIFCKSCHDDVCKCDNCEKEIEKSDVVMCDMCVKNKITEAVQYAELTKGKEWLAKHSILINNIHNIISELKDLEQTLKTTLVKKD